MRFHYYGQPQDVAGYGYYGEDPQFPGYAGYGHVEPSIRRGRPLRSLGNAGYGHTGSPSSRRIRCYGGFKSPDTVTVSPRKSPGRAACGEPETVGYYAEEILVGYYGDDPNAMA